MTSKIAVLIIVAIAFVGTISYALISMRQQALTDRLLLQRTAVNIQTLHLTANQQKALADLAVRSPHNSGLTLRINLFGASAAPASGPVNCTAVIADYNIQSTACLQKLADFAIMGNSSTACINSDADAAVLAASCKINTLQ